MSTKTHSQRPTAHRKPHGLEFNLSRMHPSLGMRCIPSLQAIQHLKIDSFTPYIARATGRVDRLDVTLSDKPDAGIACVYVKEKIRKSKRDIERCHKLKLWVRIVGAGHIPGWPVLRQLCA
eukprot:393516-Amorphochlora_amoeboformis.AAC.1